VPAAESEPPQLHVTSAAYDGRTLSLTWTGAPDARYNVQVAKSDQTVVAETVVEGLSAMLDFAAEPGAGYTVDVSEATGAANLVGGPVSFVTDGCTVTSAATSSDRQVTIEWEPPDWPPRNVSGFVPVVLWEGTETPLAEQDGEADAAPVTEGREADGDRTGIAGGCRSESGGIRRRLKQRRGLASVRQQFAGGEIKQCHREPP